VLFAVAELLVYYEIDRIEYSYAKPVIFCFSDYWCILCFSQTGVAISCKRTNS